MHSSMDSSTNIDNNTTQTEMANHWLPTVVTLTNTDPNQPKPRVKLPIALRQDSFQ